MSSLRAYGNGTVQRLRPVGDTGTTRSTLQSKPCLGSTTNFRISLVESVQCEGTTRISSLALGIASMESSHLPNAALAGSDSQTTQQVGPRSRGHFLNRIEFRFFRPNKITSPAYSPVGALIRPVSSVEHGVLEFGDRPHIGSRLFERYLIRMSTASHRSW